MGRLLVVTAASGALLGCAQDAAQESTAAQPVVQHSAEEGGDADEANSGEDVPRGSEGGDPGTSDSETSDSDTSDPETGAAAPSGVQIPSIDLDVNQLVDLQIQDDGRLEEPSGWNDVGWFSGGSTPGEAGSTVIAGHVDSPTGPAVFYRLLEMAEGDEVTLVDTEGREHLYHVETVADFPKDDFPTREVFGATPEDELRLITCTGEFDDAAGRHLDNRVVFASRVR